MDENAGGFIDAHVHIYPEIMSRDEARAAKPNSALPAGFSVQDLFDVARPLGVGRFVLIQPGALGADNSLLLGAIQSHPGVFAGVIRAGSQLDLTPEKLLRFKRLGVRGIRISPSARGEEAWLSGGAMEALWSAAADLEFAICLLVDSDDLSVVDDMCRKFPATKVVIDHLARIGRQAAIAPHHVHQLCKMSRHPRIYVKLSAFYCLGRKQPPYDDLIPFIKRVYSVFGAPRLMWGSDSPYQLCSPHTYQNSFNLIRNRIDTFSEADKQWMLSQTAESLFFAQ